jgi:hypothetical protein
MSATVPQHDDHEAGLGPPRFTLRTLLLAVTAMGCLFGLMTVLGSLWSMAILFFSCLIMGHVLGNSLGTTLRDRASRRVTREQGLAFSSVPPAIVKLEVAAPGRLSQRARLNRITLVMTFGGALAGGTLGGTLSALIYPDAGAAAVGLGVVSSAVLGAFVGFAASSFVSVARAALGEALRDPAIHRFSQHPPR